MLMLLPSTLLLFLCMSFVTAAPIPFRDPAAPLPNTMTSYVNETSNGLFNKEYRAKSVTPPKVEVWENEASPKINDDLEFTEADMDALEQFLHEELTALAKEGDPDATYRIELTLEGDSIDPSVFSDFVHLLLPEGFTVLKKTVSAKSVEELEPNVVLVKRQGSTSLSKLFPIQKAVAKWTTAPGVAGSLPLSDATFRIGKDGSGSNKQYTTLGGRKVMKSHFPKGSFNPSHKPKGGLSFYAPGPSSVDLSTAREAIFSYSLMFPKGFNFVKGGKLPGFYGGDSDSIAVGCSGGRRATNCFSARLMWRPQGAGELYTYLPQPDNPGFEANAKICDRPNTECNPTYGASIDRGSFKFTPGKWLTVSEHLRLNDVGKSNGFIQIYADGKKVIDVQDIVMRKSDKGRIRGMQVQTFFGGSTTAWATPKDQDMYFADFSAAIVEAF